MKNITSKLFFPLLVAGSLILPQKLSAQESQQNFPQTHFSLGVMGYRDQDKNINEAYGLIPGARVALTTDYSQNKRTDLGFSFLTKSREIEEFSGGKATTTILVTDFSFHYVSPQGPSKDWAWIGGGGIANVYVNEKGQIGNYSESIDGSGFGVKLTGGAEFGRNSKKRGYAQLSAIPALSGDLSGMNMGLIELGFRF